MTWPQCPQRYRALMRKNERRWVYTEATDSWWLLWWRRQELDHPAWCVRPWVPLIDSCLCAQHPSKLQSLVCQKKKKTLSQHTLIRKALHTVYFSNFSSGGARSQLIAPIPPETDMCSAKRPMCCTDHVLQTPPSVWHTNTIFRPFQSRSEHSYHIHKDAVNHCQIFH